MIDQRTEDADVAAIRKVATVHGQLSAGLARLAADLMTEAHQTPVDLREQLERRACRLTAASAQAAAVASSAGRALLTHAVARLTPDSVAPAKPGRDLEEIRAEIARRKGQARPQSAQ